MPSFFLLVATLAQPNAYDGKSATEWIQSFESTNAETRRRAAYALGQLGPTAADVAVPALIQRLKDETNAEALWYIADSLGKFGAAAKDAVPELQAALDEPAYQNQLHIRLNVIRALGRIGPDAAPAIPALSPLVASREPEISLAAAVAWWRIERKRDALAAIVDRLKDSQPLVAYEACTVLLEIGDRSQAVGSGLLAALRHPDADVRRAAAKSLTLFDPRIVRGVNAGRAKKEIDIDTWLVALEFIADAARRNVLYKPGAIDFDTLDPFVVTKMGELDVQGILIKLLDQDLFRQRATQVLAKLGPLSAERLLSAARDDHQHAPEVLALAEKYLPEPTFQSDAYAALKRRLFDSLIQTMSHPKEPVRTVGLRLFVAMSYREPYARSASSVLNDRFRDTDPRNRKLAKEALDRLQ